MIENKSTLTLVLVLTLIVFLIGLFYLLISLFPHPSKISKKTVKLFNNRNKIKKQDASTSSFDDLLRSWALKLAKYISLNPIDKAETTKALQIIGESWTAEGFRAYCIIQGLIFVSAGLFVFLLGIIASMGMMKFIGAGLIVFGVIVYILKKRSTTTKQKATVTAIEGELPRFVSYIALALQNNNNSILSLIERYTPHSEVFEAELNQTMADAKSSSFSAGLARWDNRINSDRLKSVIHGLIAANNGDDVKTYFAMLDEEFTNYQEAILKQRAKSMPKRMQMPKLLMFIMIFITMFFPIVMQVIDAFSTVFN